MLRVDNVNKKYGEKEVLSNITFSVNKGEIVSLIGNNGSGKTTLFKIIASLLDTDEGKVFFENNEIHLQDIGFLPEDRCLYYDCTVYQQLKLVCDLNNFEDSDQQIDLWLEKMGLEDKKKEKIYKLSKGNQQKISLITCLIKEPRIIILDEPFTGLDINNISLFEDIISQTIDEERIIFISSHIYDPINRFCDRYLVLKNGNIILNITKKQLEEREKRVITLNKAVEIKNYEKSFESNGRMKYIFTNEENALKEIRSLNRRKENDYSYAHLSIEDLVNCL